MKFENSPFNIPKTFHGKENNQLNLETVLKNIGSKLGNEENA